MLPSFRLLVLILITSLFFVLASFIPITIWLVPFYLICLGVLLVIDYRITPKPSQIEVERIHDSKLSLGAENRVTLLFANHSARTIHCTVRDEYPYQLPSDKLLLQGDIEGFGLWEAVYHLRPLQRGDYQFGNTNIRYPSVLRLFIRQHSYPTANQVKVYPNVLEVRKYDLLARQGLLTELGLRRSRLFGMGSEFERLREYSSDDEFRRINWKATARRGRPIVAEYETERSQHIFCVIDTGRLMRTPIGDIAKLDYVINASLLLSYVALLKGDQVGMLSFADDVRAYLAPKGGKAQFQRMLETLYNVASELVEPNYLLALSQLEHKHKRRSLMIVFTDLVTLDAAKSLIASLARLAKRHLVVCVTISDPNLTNVAGQSSETSNQLYRRAVAEMLLDERQVVLETLNQHGVHTVDVPADKLTISVINSYLELKGRGAL
jgi:Uncharacterized conserved protein (some members contain a von Willebrand factor type A (vWA) domain)